MSVKEKLMKERAKKQGTVARLVESLPEQDRQHFIEAAQHSIRTRSWHVAEETGSKVAVESFRRWRISL